MLFPLRLVDFETLRDWERFDVDTGNDSARPPFPEISLPFLSRSPSSSRPDANPESKTGSTVDRLRLTFAGDITKHR
jgi:hypothetical protein